MSTKKSTNKELVDALIALNQDGRYDQIIENARNNRYHDYKNPDDVPCGKVQFITDTAPFAQELYELREQIKNGEYDEEADPEDIKSMREDLLMDSAPDAFFKQLGFEIPTPQERAYFAARKKNHLN